MVESVTRLADARVGCMSLIGVGGKPPHSWGNYFWLAEGRKEGPRVANFWAENLQALVADGTLADGKVLTREYCDGRYCIIIDPRIPAEYFYDKLCFTGTYPPSVDVIEDMYSFHGDPTNELEKYTNPKKYYESRGSSYNEKTGIISTKINASSRPLKGTWTCDIKDTACYYAPGVQTKITEILNNEN